MSEQDIVLRLRDMAHLCIETSPPQMIMRHAADEIERLRHESRNARELHKAIQQMHKRANVALETPDTTGIGQDVAAMVFLIHSSWRQLEWYKTALKGDKDENKAEIERLRRQCEALRIARDEMQRKYMGVGGLS